MTIPNPIPDVSEETIECVLELEKVADLLSVPASWIYNRRNVVGSERPPGIKLSKYWRIRDPNAFRLLEIPVPESEQARKLAKSAESLALQVKQLRLASLETDALNWIARAQEANLELGRIFDESKALLGERAWKGYFRAKFAPHRVALQTAQTYIRMAKESDTTSETARPGLFGSATDSEAQSISNAAQSAREIVTAINKKGKARQVTKNKRNAFRERP